MVKTKKKKKKEDKPEWYNDKLSKQLWKPDIDDTFKVQHDFTNFKIVDQINNNINKTILIKPNKIIDVKEQIKKLEDKKNNKIAKTNNEAKIKSIITKHNKVVSNIDNVLIVVQHRICINKKQRKIIFNWMNECTKVYNYCVKLFNHNSSSFDLDYTKTKLRVFNALYYNESKLAPYDILTDEVKTFCSNVKSAYTNLRNQNIKKFKMKNKNVSSSQTILIPHISIQKNGFFKTFLGNIFDFEKKFDVDKICSDCKLTFNKKTNSFTLYSPQYKKTQTPNQQNEICALDPGEAIFMTYYGLDSCGKIGENIRKPILNQEAKIRKYQRILNNNKNKNGDKLKDRRSIKKKLRNCYKKIKNIVKELHNQSSLYLCKKYKKILIPEFKTQKMLRNKKKPKTKEELKEKHKENRLNKRVKFMLNMLSHYKFRQQLLHKAEEYGCEVLIVKEEYTSKCCGNCGHLSNNYIGRIKKCPFCKFEMNRDINGSRNILMKNISPLIAKKKLRL